jgi:hypothetical protein
MRNAFLTLLLINLAFLGWARWVDAPRPHAEALSRLPRLELVNEAPPDSKVPAAGGAHKTALRAPEGADTCVSVGPFGDLAAVVRAARALRARGLVPNQRTEEAATPEGFWVHIDTARTTADVARVMQDLEQHGIQDARPMAEGRRISVGLFSERARAERRARAVQELGFETEITQRNLPGTVYWLDLTIPSGAEPLRGVPWEAGRMPATVQRCSGNSPSPVEQPETPDPTPDGFGSSLPRTTVASAPKRP